jgi:hypothetical protein
MHSGSLKATTQRGQLVDRLTPAMLLAASQAFSKDVGLLATFLGIGVIVNVIVVFIAVQIRGERQQNHRRRP